MEGHNGDIAARGFQEAQLCLFPAPWGWACSGPSRGCFSLAMTPLPLSHCAARAVVLWLCSGPCPAPLLPWGPSAMGLGLCGQCPPMSPDVSSLPFQLSYSSSGPCFPRCQLPLSQFTFQLFLSLCAAISFTEDLVMAVVSGSSLCPPVPPWHLPLMSICGTVQHPGTSFKLIPGMC